MLSIMYFLMRSGAFFPENGRKLVKTCFIDQHQEFRIIM
jgi:hypothetical protein